MLCGEVSNLYRLVARCLVHGPSRGKSRRNIESKTSGHCGSEGYHAYSLSLISFLDAHTWTFYHVLKLKWSWAETLLFP
jgi:hypothetical protein